MKSFKIQGVCGKARTGKLITAHKVIDTPFFMPVATKGTVKLLSNEEVEATGTQCLISNAFILSMKPGLDVIKKHKGLHKFMNWKNGIFTDSGGFQVLSDTFCLKLTEEGVLFRNPFTGKKMIFSPEKSIEIQNSLGNDVAMCLDDVPKAGVSLERLEESAERTFEWAKRCKKAHNNPKQLLFGICQGGINKSLRKKSTEQITSLDFDGYAIGGLAIGESMKKMLNTVEQAIDLLPKDKPRYLMGVGSIAELISSVACGVDCFDSAFPTQTARHGKVFTREGNMNISIAKNKFDLNPLDSKCKCFVCKNYSRSFIHHIFKTKEENSMKYISYHNLFFIQDLMKRMRKEIKNNSFSEKKLLKEFTGAKK